MLVEEMAKEERIWGRLKSKFKIIKSFTLGMKETQ